MRTNARIEAAGGAAHGDIDLASLHRALQAVLRGHRNVGVEPLLLQQAITFFGVDRVMFGSDTPMDDGAVETFIPNTLASIEQLGLGDEHHRAVLAGTAQRLFAAWLPSP